MASITPALWGAAGSCCPGLDGELQQCCPGFKEQQLFEPCIGQEWPGCPPWPWQMDVDSMWQLFWNPRLWVWKIRVTSADELCVVCCSGARLWKGGERFTKGSRKVWIPLFMNIYAHENIITIPIWWWRLGSAGCLGRTKCWRDAVESEGSNGIYMSVIVITS